MKIIRHDTGALWCVMMRELRRILSSPLYIICMVGMPLFAYIFFLTMMYQGLPDNIPIAVIDNDNSITSRNFIRLLSVQQEIELYSHLENFSDARQAMQQGQVYGFIHIPQRFEAMIYDGKQPVISFYTNDAYLIPGSLLYKSFTTVSTLASAAVVQEVLLDVGVSQRQIMAILQPIVVDMHPLGNPWLNYSVYLNNSFLPAVLQLMILLVTVYSIGVEVKKRTSRVWLRTAHNSIIIAITGKMLPHTVIFLIMGWLLQSLLYGFLQFPQHSHILNMMTAMLLLVLASQALALIVVSLSPSFSIAFSAVGVVGVLSFSLGGFSFPVADMYPIFKILTNLLPVRHYFLIYVNEALNGYLPYYCRWQYAALIGFVFISTFVLYRMKRLLVKSKFMME